MAEKTNFIFPTAEEARTQAFVFHLDTWVRDEKRRGFNLDAITEAWVKVYAAKCSLKRVHERSGLMVASSRWPRQLAPRRIADETPAVRLGRVARKISATEWHELYPLFLSTVVYNFPQYLAAEGGAL